VSTRTLFIHIPKNAGTSISASCPSVATSPRYMTEKLISVEKMSVHSPYTMIPTSIQHKHIPYSYLDRNKIDRFDRFFAVVRNPWSRLVSLYNYADAIYPRVNKTWYGQEKISWEEYLNRMDSFRINSSYYWQHPYDQWGTQIDWVSFGDKVKCDILRYENIQDDLNDYFDKEIKLEKENVGVYKRHYTEYYTEEQKKKVADWFRLDIERWGFSFESGATRNYWTQ